MTVTGNDRLLDSFRSLTAAEVRAVVGYPGTYEYSIVSCDKDSISAEPTDSSLDLPGLNHVPMRPSAIGTVKPLPGKTCHIIFLNGDLRKPACTWVEPDAGQPIARKGDSVRVTIPAGSFLVAASGGTFNPLPVNVDGTVTDGSDRVTSE